MQGTIVNSDALYSDEAAVMPLNKKDWDDIKRFVAKARPEEKTATVSPASTVVPITTTDNWFKRNAYWFPILTPIITVLLFAIGVGFGWFNSIFDGRIANKLNEPNGLNAQMLKLTSSIDTANGELNAIRKLWEEQLKKTGELRPEQFKKALPEMANTLKAAHALKLRPPANTLASIQEGLRTTDSAVPGYWAATSEFVSYQSEQESKQSFEPRMPRCYDKMPGVYLTLGQKEGVDALRSPEGWQSCMVNLKEDVPQDLWDFILKDKLFRLDIDAPAEKFLYFENCVIKYEGGTIPYRVERLLGLTILRNCLLEFSFSSPPSPEGKRLIATLLMSQSTAGADLRSLRQ